MWTSTTWTYVSRQIWPLLRSRRRWSQNWSSATVSSESVRWPFHEKRRQGAGLSEGALRQSGLAVEPHADGHAAAGDLK